ncbi:MAG TPA: hypothetical protein VF574_07200 [Allosphingosinicella sp.]|jgi:hypothetical protein
MTTLDATALLGALAAVLTALSELVRAMRRPLNQQDEAARKE